MPKIAIVSKSPDGMKFEVIMDTELIEILKSIDEQKLLAAEHQPETSLVDLIKEQLILKGRRFGERPLILDIEFFIKRFGYDPTTQGKLFTDDMAILNFEFQRSKDIESIYFTPNTGDEKRKGKWRIPEFKRNGRLK